MMIDPTEVRWCGKPLSALTRDELEKAFVWLFVKYREGTSAEAIEQRALGRVAQLKRGAA